MLVGFGLCASVALARSLRVASAGLSGEFLPLWIAHDRAIFQKYGLDTEVITFQAGIAWAYDWIDTTMDFARKNREVVINFLKAYIEGNAYM